MTFRAVIEILGEIQTRAAKAAPALSRIWPWLLIVPLAFFYLRLGALNEFHFRNGLDLGTYNTTLHQITHGRLIPFNQLKGGVTWGDHASFILYVLAPFYMLWPGPQFLIVVQVLSVVLGAWAVYRTAEKVTRNYLFSTLLLAAYLLFFGVQYALDFDFHASVLSGAAVACALYAVVLKRWWWYALAVALGLLVREDIALFFFMIALYFLIFERRTTSKIWMSATIVVSLAYFGVVNFIIMPRYSPGQTPLLYFDAAGSNHNAGHVVWWLLSHPLFILSKIFGDEINRHTLRHLAQAFGYLPLLSPFTYLVAAPNLVARFLSEEYQRHLMSFHYNASLVSILSFGAIKAFQNIENFAKRFEMPRFGRIILTSAACILLVSGTYLSSWQDPDLPLHKLEREEFTGAEFQPRLSRGAMQIIQAMIPPEKSVSAASGLVPALSGRPYIFNYPEPFPAKETQWVVLSSEFNTWPLPKGEMEAAINEMQQNPRYEIVWRDYGIWAFHKKVSASL